MMTFNDNIRGNIKNYQSGDHFKLISISNVQIANDEKNTIIHNRSDPKFSLFLRRK